jgi:hypothetical protein
LSFPLFKKLYGATLNWFNSKLCWHQGIKADFQSSHEAPRSSLWVHAWALSSNHNAKLLILIRCKHSQRAARSFMRGLEIHLKYKLRLIELGIGTNPVYCLFIICDIKILKLQHRPQVVDFLLKGSVII